MKVRKHQGGYSLILPAPTTSRVQHVMEKGGKNPDKATVVRRISGQMPAWAVWTRSGTVKQV